MQHLRRRLSLMAAGLLFVAARADAQPQPLPKGYAGNASCTECHRVVAAKFAETPKGQLLMRKPRDDKERLGCESCHGPSKTHVQSGGEERGEMLTFSGKKGGTTEQKNASCLQCHDKTARIHWKGSIHEQRNVACTDCHNTMHPSSERGSLRKVNSTETCGRCHQAQKARQQRNSHMPLAQNKMECTSCHAPHGSANDKLLIASSVNETCFTCHAEKRGPFLWEHAPVPESCANCHDSHGSSYDKMLKMARPRLCQQCHIGTGHPTTPRNPALPADLQFVFNRSCSNCHYNIHGSNHPGGYAFTR
jgi:DmsE family decaheme c-type cytochrome